MRQFLVACCLLVCVGFAAAWSCPDWESEEALQEARINVAVLYLKWGVWLLDPRPSVEEWTAKMKSIMVNETYHNVEQSGEWGPLEMVLEYGLLGNPEYNDNNFEWTRRDPRNDTIKWLSENELYIETEEDVVRAQKGEEFYNETGINRFEFVNCSEKLLYIYNNLSGDFLRDEESPPISFICAGIAVVCQGENQQYANMEECTKFMESLPGTCADYPLKGNSTLCRTLHLLNAQIDAKTHCPHCGKDSSVCQTDFCTAGYVPTVYTDDSSSQSDGDSDGSSASSEDSANSRLRQLLLV